MSTINKPNLSALSKEWESMKIQNASLDEIKKRLASVEDDTEAQMEDKDGTICNGGVAFYYRVGYGEYDVLRLDDPELINECIDTLVEKLKKQIEEAESLRQ